MRLGLGMAYWKRLGHSWDESWDILHWQAQFGEANGYHRVWVTEHHATEYGATNSTSVLLSFIAAGTKRLRLGYSVALLPFHQPIRLAEEMLLLDKLSKGRIDIGVGRGHSPLESALLCPDPERSVDLFNDGYAILKHAFSGEPFAFQGAYWKFPRVQLLPPPTQRNIRMHMVMTSPRSIAFAAQEGATPIVGNRPPEFIKAQLDQYVQFARDAGKTEEEIAAAMDGVTASRYIAYADSRDEARERAAHDIAHYGYAVTIYDLPVGDPAFHNDVRPIPPRALADDPHGTNTVFGNRDDIIDQIRDLERVGVRNLNIRVDSPITPPDEAKRRLIRFTEEILPHVGLKRG